MTIELPAATEEVVVDLKQLPRDMKRLLRMQWKEFMHFVDDAQLALAIEPVRKHYAA